MRVLRALLVAAVAVAVAPLAGQQAAHANSFPGLNEESWTRVDSPSGDSYTLTARLAIELTSTQSEGRFRLRLSCTRTDADTGATSANGCDFSFGSTAGAEWCSGASSPTSCVTRDLDDRGNTSEEVWVGSWHTMTNGQYYKVIASEFKANFNNGNGPAGVFHSLSAGTYRGHKIAGLARAEIGVGEPGCDKYLSGACNGGGTPWCAIFAIHIWRSAGINVDTGGDFSARGLGQWGVNHGRFVSRSAGPRVGDMVIYGAPAAGTPGGHNDIVVKVFSSTDIVVVGGNVSNQVRERRINPETQRMGTSNLPVSGYVRVHP